MEPLEALGQVTLISGLIVKLVDLTRKRFPSIDGYLVNGAAVVFGILIAWGLELDVSMELAGQALTAPLNYIISGLAVGLGAGVVSDIIKPSVTEPIQVEPVIEAVEEQSDTPTPWEEGH